jgi:hypothetical protein
MGLETERVHPTRFACEKAFMVGALMFISDPTVNREKRWKKRRRLARQGIHRS